MRKMSIIFMVLVGFALMAYRFQPQNPRLSSDIGDGWYDASTDCDGETDLDVDCANTGAIDVSGWPQATVRINYARVAGAAGTQINMQCDEMDLQDLNTWHMKVKCDGDTCTARTWEYATTANVSITYHFGINADKLRCRFWVTSGTSGDTIKVRYRAASTVGD